MGLQSAVCLGFVRVGRKEGLGVWHQQDLVVDGDGAVARGGLAG